MSFAQTLGYEAGQPKKQRSADWGGKALLVCALAVLMAIPGLFVWGLIAERAKRAETVTREVSALQGGAQQVLGPLLVTPYRVPAEPPAPGQPRGQDLFGWYVVSPDQATATVNARTDTLKRGIFDVPVYAATAELTARFAPATLPPALPAGAVLDPSRAQLVLGFTDLRGAKADVAATLRTGAGATQLAFAPAADLSLGSPGFAQGVTGASDGSFGLVAAPAAPLLAAGGGGELRIGLRFTGAERVSVLPFAKSTRVAIAGDWGAPKFDGGFLPETRRVNGRGGDPGYGEDSSGQPKAQTGRGFTANWSVPFLARGLPDRASSDTLSLSALGQKDLGVTFVRTNNPYQNVIRALKYAVMFVGLVFLTFFVFEALSGRRLHPAQYVLIGLAQMVFYLLLLSLSEYIGFDFAFLVAAVATVLLIGLYAGAAFRERRFRVLALVVFTVVYALIYALMRLEDFALLAGSLASFTGLALAMWLTRNIDWYGGRAQPDPAVEPPPPAAPPAPLPV